MSVWVFGYGSLVSPTSLSATIGRAIDTVDGYRPAVLAGYGRRWNYGSLRQRARWTVANRTVDGGVVVSLGIESAADESTNGALAEVDDAELALLDRRESDYDRVEVTELIRPRPAGLVVTYVPRASSIARYERARAEETAAVRLGYVELVEYAFAALGDDQLDRYRRTTPTPDVPILTFDDLWLEHA